MADLKRCAGCDLLTAARGDFCPVCRAMSKNVGMRPLAPVWDVLDAELADTLESEHARWSQRKVAREPTASKTPSRARPS